MNVLQESGARGSVVDTTDTSAVNEAASDPA